MLFRSGAILPSAWGINYLLHNPPQKSKRFAAFVTGWNVYTRMVDDNILRPVSCGQGSPGTRPISTSRLWDQTMAWILRVSYYYYCDKLDAMIVKLLSKLSFIPDSGYPV